MRLPKTVTCGALAVSLAANLLLASICLRVAHRDLPPTNVGTGQLLTRVRSRPPSDRPARPLSAERTRTSWERIAGGNLQECIGNLRSMGCPENTVQDIVIGEIARTFNPRLAELRRRPTPFWEPVQRRNPTDEELKQQQRRDDEVAQLESQRNGMVRDLVGISMDSYLAGISGSVEPFTEELSGVQPVLRQPARAILKQYASLEEQLIARAGGTLGLQEQAEMAQLYSAKLAELRLVLSPEQIEEYNSAPHPPPISCGSSLWLALRRPSVNSATYSGS